MKTWLSFVVAIAVAGCMTGPAPTSTTTPGVSPHASAEVQTEPPNTPDIRVVSNASFWQGDVLHVIGEVRNAGPSGASNVTIDAAVFAANGTLWQTVQFRALRSVVPSSEISPFEGAVDGAPPAASVSILMAAGGERLEAAPVADLVVRPDEHEGRFHEECTGSTAAGDLSCRHVVSGHVANQGEDAASGIKVIASFYDNQGRIHRVGSGTTTPGTIAPGAVGDFKVAPQPRQESYSSHFLWVEVDAG